MEDLLKKLTDPQRDAARSDGCSLLVSASAGSGKTGTLTARVVRLLLDETRPVDADRLLVLTFTRAAAAQMKARIAGQLSRAAADNPRAARQLLLLPSAQIGTIDSFCLWVVRQYGHDHGLPANLSVADEARCEALERQVLEQLIADQYEATEDGSDDSKEFVRLAELFFDKTERALPRAVFWLHQYCQSLPDAEGWLSAAPSVYEGEDAVRRCCEAAARECVPELHCVHDHYETLCRFAAESGQMEREAFFAARIEAAAALTALAEAGDYAGLRTGLADFPAGSLPRKTADCPAEDAELLKEGNADCKDRLKKLQDAFFAADEAALPEEMRQLAFYTGALCRLTQQYEARLREEKLQKEIFGYGDVARYAEQILCRRGENGRMEPTREALELRERYADVMVDECQDVNGLQNRIFEAVSRGDNLFMVGDIKQSIYRFRRAEPTLFVRRAAEYTAGRGGRVIPLSRNFRSSPAVLDTVNAVFGALMHGEAAEVDYDESHRLICNDPARFSDGGVVELAYLQKTSGEDETAIEQEAAYCVDKIRELMKTGYGAQDPNRRVRLSDFCILTQTNEYARQMARQLTAAGIGNVCVSDSGFFEQTETAAVLAALWALDNPLNDLALLSALLSPIWDFDADDAGALKARDTTRTRDDQKPLYALVREAAEGEDALAGKCRRLLGDFDTLRGYSVLLPLGELVSALIELTGFEAFAAAMDNGGKRLENLARLVKYASAEGARGCGLADFVRRTGEMIDGGRSPQMGGGSPTDAVTVCNVHKSKGLEYPVCFLVENAKPFNNKYDAPLMGGADGFSSALPTPDGGGRYLPLAWQVLRSRERRQNDAEHLRQLYVAMTRAEYRLYMTVRADLEKGWFAKAAARRIDGPYAMMSENSFGGWLTQTLGLAAECEAPAGEVRLPLPGTDTRVSVRTHYADGGERSAVLPPPTVADAGLVARLENRLDNRYERAALTRRPQKYTVTALTGADADGGELAEPAFCSAGRGANYGTELHRFMQLCDFERAALSSRQEAERLAAEGHLNAGALELLNFEAVDAFFASDYAETLLRGGRLLREYDFIAEVPLSMVEPDVEAAFADEPVVLQGCADCVAFFPEGLWLLDYKTDRLKTPADFIARYARQLELYALCLSRIFGQPVVRKTIYSFRLNAAIDLPNDTGGEKS